MLWGFSFQQCRPGTPSAGPTVVQTSLTITPVTPPVLQLACSDTTVANVILLIFSTLITAPTVSVISVSYTYILVTICRMRSLEAQRKAFSTCASHLTVLQGTILFIYCRPHSGNSMDTDKVATVFYTVVIPMVNPLIYSLRNKDVKEALRKVVNSKILS